MSLFRRNAERRVDHAERLEQPLAEDRAERPARNDFDDAGRDVDSDAVLEAGSRLEGERKPRKIVDPLRQGAMRVQQLALRPRLEEIFRFSPDGRASLSDRVIK